MMPHKISSVKLLDNVSAVVVGARHEPWNTIRTLQLVSATTAGAGTADVSIQASNDGDNYLEIGTISLVTGVTAATDGFVSDAPWRYVRAELTALTGTGATATVLMGG